MGLKSEGYYINYGVLSTGLDIVKCKLLEIKYSCYIIEVKKRRMKVKRYHLAFTLKEAERKAYKMADVMYKEMRSDIRERIKSLKEK